MANSAAPARVVTRPWRRCAPRGARRSSSRSRAPRRRRPRRGAGIRDRVGRPWSDGGSRTVDALVVSDGE